MPATSSVFRAIRGRSIVRDIEIIKRELPARHPGSSFSSLRCPVSEDHKILWQERGLDGPRHEQVRPQSSVYRIIPRLSDEEMGGCLSRGLGRPINTPEQRCARSCAGRRPCRLGRPGTTLTTILWFYLMIAFEGVPFRWRAAALRLKFPARSPGMGLPACPIRSCSIHVYLGGDPLCQDCGVTGRSTSASKSCARRSAERLRTAGPTPISRIAPPAEPTNSRRSISTTRHQRRRGGRLRGMRRDDAIRARPVSGWVRQPQALHRQRK